MAQQEDNTIYYPAGIQELWKNKVDTDSQTYDSDLIHGYECKACRISKYLVDEDEEFQLIEGRAE
jgi:hypothetical protein